MDIAKQKRDENIAEYVLYIWQLEDLMRAMQFSPEAVFIALVAPRTADEKWKLAALEWYMDIASLLQKEEKAEGGHLDHTLHIIADMNDLHLTLLQQPVGREYRKLFERLAPELPALRATLGREDASDIELAFRVLYAAMLYRMAATAKAAGQTTRNAAGETKGATTETSAAETANAAPDKSGIADGVIELVSPVIALLADTYHKVERGEIDIYGAR